MDICELCIDNLHPKSPFYNYPKLRCYKYTCIGPHPPAHAATKRKRLEIKLKYPYISTTFHCSILTAYRIHSLIFLNASINLYEGVISHSLWALFYCNHHCCFHCCCKHIPANMGRKVPDSAAFHQRTCVFCIYTLKARRNFH